MKEKERERKMKRKGNMHCDEEEKAEWKRERKVEGSGLWLEFEKRE